MCFLPLCVFVCLFNQVLTPVRRSARKVLVKGGGPAATPAPSAHATTAAVQPMLEATNYCYHPNDALKQ